MVKRLACLSALALALGQLSCGNMPPPSAQQEGQVVTIRISGAWALYPLVRQWAQEYQRQHPDIQVGVWPGGTAKGLIDVTDGLVDIAMASRPLSREEQVKGLFAVPVARSAVVLMANSGNPAATRLTACGLTPRQCADLWAKGKKLTWGELVGDPAVRAAVQPYTRSDLCGAAEVFGQFLGVRQGELRGARAYGDPGMLEALREDRLGLGFVNAAYAYDPATGRPPAGLLAVPVDVDGDRQVGTRERCGTRQELMQAVAAGAYPRPLVRDLLLVTRGRPQGVVREFLRWAVRSAARRAEEAGCIALGEEELGAAARRLE